MVVKKGRKRKQGQGGGLTASPQLTPRSPCLQTPVLSSFTVGATSFSTFLGIIIFLPDPAFSPISPAFFKLLELLCILRIEEAGGQQLPLGALVGKVCVSAADPGAGHCPHLASAPSPT